MLLDEAIQRIRADEDVADSVKTLLYANVPEIEAAASRHSIELDYLVELALGTAERHLYGSSDLLERVNEYWLKCDNVAGSTPYEVIVCAAEFLATAFQTRPVSVAKLRELAESSDWHDRVVAGWVVRDRTDEVAKDIATILATDKFTDDNGFFLVREAIGEYG